MQGSMLRNGISYGLIFLCAYVLAIRIPVLADNLTLGIFFRLILLPVAVFMAMLALMQTRGPGWTNLRSHLPSGRLTVAFLLPVSLLVGVLITHYGERFNPVAASVFVMVIVCYFLALYFMIAGKEHYALVVFLLSMPWLEFVEWEIGARFGLFTLMIGDIALSIKGTYIFVVSLFGVWVASRLAQGKFPLTNPRLCVPIVLLLFYTLTSVLLFTYSHNQELALNGVVNALVVPFLLYILVLETVDTEDKLYLMVYSLIALVVMYSFIRFYLAYRVGYVTSDLEEMEARHGSFKVAGQIALITPLLLAILATVKDRRYLLLTTGLTVYAAVLQLLSFTRSGLLAMLAGAACLLTKRRAQLLVVLVLIIALVFWDPLYNLLLIRFRDIHSFEDLTLEHLSYARYEAWIAAISMLREQPILGVGQGNFLDYSPRFSKPYWIVPPDEKPYLAYMPSAHNLFLNVAGTLGLVGLGILLLFLGMLLLRLVQGLLVVRGTRLEPLGWGLLGFYVAHFAIAMFGPGFWRARDLMGDTVLYWTLFALIVLLRSVGDKIKSETIPRMDNCGQ